MKRQTAAANELKEKEKKMKRTNWNLFKTIFIPNQQQKRQRRQMRQMGRVSRGRDAKGHLKVKEWKINREG